MCDWTLYLVNVDPWGYILKYAFMRECSQSLCGCQLLIMGAHGLVGIWACFPEPPRHASSWSCPENASCSPCRHFPISQPRRRDLLCGNKNRRGEIKGLVRKTGNLNMARWLHQSNVFSCLPFFHSFLLAYSWNKGFVPNLDPSSGLGILGKGKHRDSKEKR